MGTIASGAQCAIKAGANVSANFSGASINWEDLITQATAVVSNVTRKDWSGAFTSLNSDVRGILTDTVSSLASIHGISYDMSGYTSRIEAEDMINVQRDNALRGLSLLRIKATEDFIDGA